MSKQTISAEVQTSDRPQSVTMTLEKGSLTVSLKEQGWNRSTSMPFATAAYLLLSYEDPYPRGVNEEDDGA